MILLLCILCREFAISGLRMAVATKGQVVEADSGGKLKTFVQLNAIGWLIGARMLEQQAASARRTPEGQAAARLAASARAEAASWEGIPAGPRSVQSLVNKPLTLKEL
jgi:phosphatidylglycerophosphate synthase